MMAPAQEWVIRINLGEVDKANADWWYAFIENAIGAHGAFNDGLLSMTLEPVSEEPTT